MTDILARVFFGWATEIEITTETEEGHGTEITFLELLEWCGMWWLREEDSSPVRTCRRATGLLPGIPSKAQSSQRALLRNSHKSIGHFSSFSGILFEECLQEQSLRELLLQHRDATLGRRHPSHCWAGLQRSVLCEKIQGLQDFKKQRIWEVRLPRWNAMNNL